MKKSLFLILLSSLLIVGKNYAQKVEFNLLFGSHWSKMEFHHSSPVDYSDGYQPLEGSQFMLAMTAPVYKSWFLRTELGLIKTNVNFIINYDRQGTRNHMLAQLRNQKIFFALTPEYRIRLKPFAIKLIAGPIFSTDFSNAKTHTITLASNTTEHILSSASNPLGLKIGSGFLFKKNAIGAEINLSYLRFEKSKFIGPSNPKISFTQFQLNFGMVYSIGNTKK